jgi:hypothetical protein
LNSGAFFFQTQSTALSVSQNISSAEMAENRKFGKEGDISNGKKVNFPADIK